MTTGKAIIQTRSGETVFAEVNKAYDSGREELATLRSGELARAVAPLLQELKPENLAAGIKSLKVEFYIDLEQDGETIKIFVAQSGLLKLTVVFESGLPNQTGMEDDTRTDAARSS
jgi:hypothetical protein